MHLLHGVREVEYGKRSCVSYPKKVEGELRATLDKRREL